MKEYYVYFDAFGKKLKVKVNADTPEAAAAYVRQKINIEKIEAAPLYSSNQKSHYDQFFGSDFFKDLFK